MPFNRANPQDPNRLVAKFLLSNGYLDTLHAFTHESGISLDSFDDNDLAATGKEEVTLESLLEERRLREIQIQLAKVRLSELEIPEWTDTPGQWSSTELTLRAPATNVLYLTVGIVLGNWSIVVCTADRGVRIYDYTTLDLTQEYLTLHASPVLEARVLLEDRGRWLLTAGMDGKVVLTDLEHQSVCIDGLEHPHTRYVNRLLVWNGEKKYLVTSSYDKHINLYELVFTDGADPLISYISSLTLPTTPEGLTFLSTSKGALLLLVASRDTPFLEVYTVADMKHYGRINMNENNDAWVSFSAIDISIHPSRQFEDRVTIAISTSTTPHGRLLLLSCDLEDIRDDHDTRATTTATTRQAPKIGRSTIFTGAKQSDYGVLPRHVWRATGTSSGIDYEQPSSQASATGVWVNSDDGLLKGICLRSLKPVRELQGHTAGVRSLWSGMIHGNEILVSGGFDKRVLIWGRSAG